MSYTEHPTQLKKKKTIDSPCKKMLYCLVKEVIFYLMYFPVKSVPRQMGGFVCSSTSTVQGTHLKI